MDRRRDHDIEGRLYSIMLPSVRSAMSLCSATTVLVGPVIGTLGVDVAEGGWGKLTTALQSVDPKKLDELLMLAVRESSLCYRGELISSPMDFDRHFDEFRQDVFPVCIWALWECVRDFFPQLGTFAQKATEMMKTKESPSPENGPKTTGSGVPFGPGTVRGKSFPTGVSR